jgi:hypothetical protein
MQVSKPVRMPVGPAKNAGAPSLEETALKGPALPETARPETMRLENAASAEWALWKQRADGGRQLMDTADGYGAEEDSERATEAPNPSLGRYYIEAMETTRNGRNLPM